MSKTSSAIRVAVLGLEAGVGVGLLRQALVNDGFSAGKALTITLWGSQIIQKAKQHGNVSLKELGSIVQ